MKSFTPLVVVSALASQASAHYVFNQFSHAATKFPVQKYIRPNTNYNSPVTDLESNDLRCNVGGESGSATDTVTVAAGDAFSFSSDVEVYHNGPLSIYMAKAPTTAAEFDGSGKAWFKIFDLGPTFAADGTSSWPLAQTYTAKIPKQLPSGEYLVRIQQLGIHNPGGIPQFYVECAQVAVTNGGTGVPGPLVSIPGFIDGTEPGYTVNVYSNFKNYTIPGPAVWDGAAGSGTAPAPATSAAPVPAPVTSAAPASVSSVAPTTLETVVKPTTSVVKTTSTTSAVVAGPTAAKYAQCGGQGWTGATVCAAGSTCKANGAYYSQCV